jgi:hypothetical protein
MYEIAAATRGRDIPTLILSAGLGIIDWQDLVPAYSLTVSPDSRENVLAKIRPVVSASQWWHESSRFSPQFSIAAAVTRLLGERELVLLTLPNTYLRMVQKQLLALTAQTLSRLRIFTAAIVGIDVRLTPLVMPYDNRLDGSDSQLRGTISDFAARALRDFIETILPTCPTADSTRHRELIEHRIKAWAKPVRPQRQRQSDEEVMVLMQLHWRHSGGSQSRMLRFLRHDLGKACERSRLGALYEKVRLQMETECG